MEVYNLRNTKEKILTATEQLIYKKGYTGTSINDILDETATGKGQFYYYFDSKKEATLAVIDNHVKIWQTHLLNGILSRDESPLANLKEMLDWIYSDHAQKKIYYGCPVGNLVIELSALDEDFRKPLEQLFSDLQKKIAENLSALTGLLVKQNLPAAHAIIAQIQGSLVLLKVTQDLNVLESNFDLLKTSFEKVGEK